MTLNINQGPVTDSKQVDVLVIGAGFAGLGMLRRLLDDGWNALVLEAADDLGGTWYYNRYPGARCDSEAWIYNYSFSDELLQEYPLRNRYRTQAEVLEYMNWVADRLDLRRHIQFSTRVLSAVFDGHEAKWRVTTDAGTDVSARFCIASTGAIAGAQTPDIPGIENFAGAQYHTGEWPHEPVDLSGKRVGVIGTGSSGVQVVSTVAPVVEHLTVFQRTPNFVLPANDHALSGARVAQIKDNYRELLEEVKHTPSGMPYWRVSGSGLDASPQERQRLFEENWERGGFHATHSWYADVMTNAEVNEQLADFVRNKIKEIVDDPDTAEMLTPHGHHIGTKRSVIDSDYWATFNRENVTLVDIHREPIVEVTQDGVNTGGRFHALDAIIFATGYDAFTGAIGKIDIRGTSGTLREAWDDGPTTYLGLAVHGFPNLFITTGPGSPSVLTSMPTSIEFHIEFLGDLLADMRRRGAMQVEASPRAQKSWTDFCDEEAARTLMVTANSWYMGANVPGKPRRFYPYVGGLGHYRVLCTALAERGYEGFDFEGMPPVEAATVTSGSEVFE